jgi:mRNA interferase MazF
MKQGELWYADLTQVKGSEQSSFRPVLIVSGNLLNLHAPVVICCPLTTKIKNYKGNVVLEPNDQNGLKNKSEILSFHVRSIAKERLVEKIGNTTPQTVKKIINTLNDLLTY